MRVKYCKLYPPMPSPTVARKVTRDRPSRAFAPLLMHESGSKLAALRADGPNSNWRNIIIYVQKPAAGAFSPFS
jgi:hypothetical protein